MKFPTVEIEKRDRDQGTDTLIKSLLDEEKSGKKQKRDPRADAGVPQARKGKTFAEIEAEEGGPVKESLVGMAQTKRAQNRNKRDVDVGDTDLVTNTERFEKDGLEVEQEEGITFEPFNLKQEREEGYFDDDGNYVLRKKGGEDGEDERDAWLASDEAKVVSDAVRQKIEEQRARAEEAARRGPLTERQIAQRKADMAAVMRPGETVTRALKRLGGSGPTSGAGGAALPHRAMGKRERARLLTQQQQQQPPAAAGAEAGSADGADGATETLRAQFASLTELADELLAEGELEIYGATTEELLRSARMWLPQLAAAAAAAPSVPTPAFGGSSAAAAGAAAAGGDDDDDMFADDDDADKKKAAAPGASAAAAGEGDDMFADDGDEEKPTSGTGNTAQALAGPGAAQGPGSVPSEAAPGGGDNRGAAAAGPGPAPGAEAEAVDYSSWPVKELKRLLQERGVDPSGFVEKSDLVAKVKEVVAAGLAAGGPGSSAGGDGVFVAPPGYVFDPSSGYFYSEESGMYYDTSTGGYCQASTGKWFYLDSASGSLVEWKQQG